MPSAPKKHRHRRRPKVTPKELVRLRNLRKEYGLGEYAPAAISGSFRKGTARIKPGGSRLVGKKRVSRRRVTTKTIAARSKPTTRRSSSTSAFFDPRLVIPSDIRHLVPVNIEERSGDRMRKNPVKPRYSGGASSSTFGGSPFIR